MEVENWRVRGLRRDEADGAWARFSGLPRVGPRAWIAAPTKRSPWNSGQDSLILGHRSLIDGGGLGADDEGVAPGGGAGDDLVPGAPGAIELADVGQAVMVPRGGIPAGLAPLADEL